MSSLVVPKDVDIAADINLQSTYNALNTFTSKKVSSKVASNGTTILLNIGQAADQAPKPVQNVRRYNKMSRSSPSTSQKKSNTNLIDCLQTSTLLGTGIIGGIAVAATTTTTMDPNKKWHTHFVTRSDSLLSLSVRYNVTVAEIKRWNKLPNSNRKIASPKLEILINPNNPNVILPDLLEQNISRLRQSTGLGYKEATFYLGNGKTYEEALAEAQEDIKWENKQKEKTDVGVGVMEVDVDE